MVVNLKALRNAQGISQQQLANYLGISQQSVNKYENHSIEPDIESLIAMARYFDTSVDYLVGNTKTAPEEGFGLSAAEKRLVQDYRRLNQKQKTCVQCLFDAFDGNR